MYFQFDSYINNITNKIIDIIAFIFFLTYLSFSYECDKIWSIEKRLNLIIGDELCVLNKIIDNVEFVKILKKVYNV